MTRRIALVLLLFCLPAWARAQPAEEHQMTDPLARRIVCTGSHESPRTTGPQFATASMFSVPEPDGGERLYVGFVENSMDRNSRASFWRGPVALRWKGLRDVPESRPGAYLNRYRIDRLTALPGGSTQTTVMELDLERQPPLLRVVGGGPGQPAYLDSLPLGESLPMNESLERLVNLKAQRVFQTGVLRLVSYEARLRTCPAADWKDSKSWERRMHTHLLALCRRDDPGQAVLHFLPPRHRGWDLEKLLSAPAKDDLGGGFAVQMVAGFLEPSRQGFLMDSGIRYRVDVSLDRLDITEVERGLWYDVAMERWERSGSGEATVTFKPKP